MKQPLLWMLGSLAFAGAAAQTPTVDWPAVKTEAKPGARWWWLGSAVDEKNLTVNLQTYAQAGIGSVEITPIYGVIGNEKNDLDFLSDGWMKMLRHTESEGARLGIEVDMNTGTGWPFGGPEVTLEEAATKAVFNRWEHQTAATATKGKKKKIATEAYTTSILPTRPEERKALKNATLSGVWMFDEQGQTTDLSDRVEGETLTVDLESGHNYRFVALWNGKTLQAVKRAAPGGEGYVMDHFSPTAVNHYFGKFDKAFSRTGCPTPHTFFNDSYEVYGADWTPGLLTEFEKRRGYRLQDHFPDFLSEEATDHKRLVSDYRETVSDLLLEVFTQTWTRWAHGQNAITRNQAHGSPANLLDVYAAVDIPECEGFGLSDFHIRGLRTDTLTKKNDSDLSMLKYASSAAHLTGKTYTSSETFTWLTEHFRTSLSQCKPDMDLMFVSGVNHCFFHGTTYSPQEAAWPGHLFYAAMEMSPINTIWADAPAFFDYITRCQSFLQWGEPDNDFMVYLPVYDMWNDNGGRMLTFDIHNMAKKAPQFIQAVNDIYGAGYDMDYISDRMIEKTTCREGRLVSEGGAQYKALIIPAARIMQPSTVGHILDLAEAGATVIFVGGYPTDVPGMSDLATRRAALTAVMNRLPVKTFKAEPQTFKWGKGSLITAPDYVSATALSRDVCNARPETMKSDAGLACIRRSNPTGHHYFISSLQGKGVDAWVKLAKHSEAALLFDPMTGRKGRAALRQNQGVTEVRMRLASGESCILQTYDKPLAAELKDASGQALPAWCYEEPDTLHAIALTQGWSISFPNVQPEIEGSYPLQSLKPWTALPIANATTAKGTARYSIDVKMSRKQLNGGYADWVLDLGDVRESAHVYVNGVDAGIAFAVPFCINVGHLLKVGKNHIDIDVTGLAANYVAEMDRQGIVWRKFKNANIANLKGGKVSYYGNWDVMPCGLNSTVSLIPMKSE